MIAKAIKLFPTDPVLKTVDLVTGCPVATFVTPKGSTHLGPVLVTTAIAAPGTPCSRMTFSIAARRVCAPPKAESLGA
jgi:hypothetical protein